MPPLPVLDGWDNAISGSDVVDFPLRDLIADHVEIDRVAKSVILSHMPTSTPPAAGPEPAVWVRGEIASSCLVFLVEVSLLGVGATGATDFDSAHNLWVFEESL